MPQAPRRPCRMTGCPNLADPGEQFCPEHKSKAEQFYNRYQRPTDKKAYGRAWKRIRDSYAREHPLCEKCLQEGRLTPMKEVHHILPISRGGTHKRNNLMSLCQSCHTKIHHKLGDR